MKELQTKINSHKALIKQDLYEFPTSTRGGWAAKQQQAKNELPTIQREYFSELENVLFKVYVVGNKNTNLNKEFAQNLGKQVPTIVVEDVYSDLARQVQPLIGIGGEINATSWQRFLEVAGDYSDYYSSFPTSPPPMPVSQAAKSLSELRTVIKNVVETHWGESLNKQFVYQQVFNWSLKFTDDFSSGFVVVYVDEESERERNTMFSKKPSYTVSFEQEDTSTEDAVTKLIEKAKKHLKKGK